jgi:hypothetical protein
VQRRRAKNSIGDSQPKHLRWRLFISETTRCNSSSVTLLKSVPFGKKNRMSPLMFPFAPLCQGSAERRAKARQAPAGHGFFSFSRRPCSFLAGVSGDSLFSLQAIFPFWKSGGGFLAQEFAGAQKTAAAAFPAKGKRLCAGRHLTIPALGAGYFHFKELIMGINKVSDVDGLVS